MFHVNAREIKAKAKKLMPKAVQKYSVNLEAKDGHRHDFPIKQVIRAVLNDHEPGWDEEGFTAHRARDLLKRLNFQVKIQ